MKIGKYLSEFDKPALSPRAAGKELMMIVIILAAGCLGPESELLKFLQFSKWSSSGIRGAIEEPKKKENHQSFTGKMMVKSN